MEDSTVIAPSCSRVQTHDDTYEEISAPLPHSKRIKSVSKVWKDFKKIKIAGKDRAVCMHCNKDFVGSSKSGTTNLRNHLLKCPAKKSRAAHNEEITTRNETTDILTETSDIPTENKRDFVFDEERSRLDVARMIIKHGYPLEMVEHEFFEIFVKNLQPKFKLYSQDALKADILLVCKEEKLKLYKYLSMLPPLFSLIIKFWTCHSKNNVYCIFTLQFIEDALRLKKKILAVKCINDQGPTLSETVVSLLQEWNIDKKLCSITLESCLSNDIMVEMLKPQLAHRGNYHRCCRDFFYIHCTTHMISLLIQDGLHEISDILHKIRKVIKYIKETTLGKEKFEYAVRQLQNLQGKKITSEDFPTSWVSSFLMLESALEFQETFSYLENEDYEFTVNPSKEEWSMAVTLYKCLKVLYDVICRLSESKCLTANLYFPKVCDIHYNLLKWQESEHSYIRVMANKMKVKFDKYFCECRTVLVIAEILDPRRKLDFVKFAFKQFYGCDAETHLAPIRNALNSLFDDYAKDFATEAILSSSVIHDVSDNMTSYYDDCHMLSMWYNSKHGATSAISRRAELDRYLEECILPTEGEFDILSWWHTNSQNFPTLGKMTRDILAIPMSISTSNYAFSTEAMTINPTFDGHDPDIVEALICGEDWLEKPKSNAPNKADKLSADYFLDRERPAHSSQLFSEPSLSPMLQEKPVSPAATNTRLLLANLSSTLPLESNNPCSPLYVPCSPQYVSPCLPTSPITISHEPPASSDHNTPFMGLNPSTLPSANSPTPWSPIFSPLSSFSLSPAPSYTSGWLTKSANHVSSILDDDLTLGLNS